MKLLQGIPVLQRAVRRLSFWIESIEANEGTLFQACPAIEYYSWLATL